MTLHLYKSKCNLIIYLSLLLLLGCVTATKHIQKTIKQGIKGTVIYISGNQMPAPGVAPTVQKPIKSILCIFELTSVSQVVSSDQKGFYTQIRSVLVNTIETDENGNFSLTLQPGKYSIFTKIGNSFYANLFDDQNHISPVIVKTNSITSIKLHLDYNASY